MKLTSKQDLRNRSLIIPVLGKVTFDKDGFIDVDEAIANQLKEETKGSIDLFNPEEKAIRDESMPEEEKQNEAVVEMINNGTQEDVLRLSRYSGLPVDYVLGMTDARLRKELIKKSAKIAEGLAQQVNEETKEETLDVVDDVTNEVESNDVTDSLGDNLFNFEEQIEQSERDILEHMAKDANIDFSDMSDRKLKNELLKLAGFKPKRGR